MKIDKGRIINDFIEPNRRQYAIPVYQRNYEWAREQCVKLFEDIVLPTIDDGLLCVAPDEESLKAFEEHAKKRLEKKNREKANLKPCCDKLKTSLQNTKLSNPNCCGTDDDIVIEADYKDYSAVDATE